MKHQYFGDVNDNRKYGLLRCVAEATGKPLGILWLLTPDDGRSDGEFRRYLGEPAKWRHHDPELYDALTGLSAPNQIRHVSYVHLWKMLPDAIYFDKVFTDSETQRQVLMAAAQEELSQCPVILIDPDNGIEIKSVPFGSRGSKKYVYWRELSWLYQRGHSLVIYQHYPRISREKFQADLRDEFRLRLAGAQLALFSTANVVFALALRPEHAIWLATIMASVKDRWGSQMSTLVPSAQ